MTLFRSTNEPTRKNNHGQKIVANLKSIFKKTSFLFMCALCSKLPSYVITINLIM